jgi:hypothetical protein
LIGGGTTLRDGRISGGVQHVIAMTSTNKRWLLQGGGVRA